MSQLFTNNASGTLSVLLPNEAGPSTVSLQAGEGALFPNPTGGDFFICTVEDTSGNIEILLCTARATNDLTCSRGHESTTIQEFATGSRVEIRNTAATFDAFLQVAGGVMTGELDMNNNLLTDPLLTGGEIRNSPIRGTDGGTGNQIVVPTAAGAPTIGGNTIVHTGNDSAYVQTTFALTGGEGVAAIGDLSTPRTINLDINELTTIAGTDVLAADQFLVYDDANTLHKVVNYRSAGIPIIIDSGVTVTPTDDQMNSMFLCTHSAAAISFELNTTIGEKGNIVIVQQSDGTRQVTIGGTATINSAAAGPTTVQQFSVLVCVCTATNVWTVYGDAQ